MVLAAALGFESAQIAIDTYANNPQYLSAKATGNMSEKEDHVVKRTICVCEYDSQYDMKVQK